MERVDLTKEVQSLCLDLMSVRDFEKILKIQILVVGFVKETIIDLSRSDPWDTGVHLPEFLRTDKFGKPIPKPKPIRRRDRW